MESLLASASPGGVGRAVAEANFDAVAVDGEVTNLNLGRIELFGCRFLLAVGVNLGGTLHGPGNRQAVVGGHKVCAVEVLLHHVIVHHVVRNALYCRSLIQAAASAVGLECESLIGIFGADPCSNDGRADAVGGFFTTFLMKQRLGIFGFGKASLGLGLLLISINWNLFV